MALPDVNRRGYARLPVSDVSWQGMLAVLEDSPALIAIWMGEDLHLAFQNRAARTVIGPLRIDITAEAAYPQNPDYVVHLREVLDSGRGSSLRHRPTTVGRAGGETSAARVVDIVMSPLRDDAGAVVGVVAQAVEVRGRSVEDVRVATVLALDRAGQELTRSLDVDQVSRTVTRLAGEVLLGWGILDLRQGDGSLLRVAVTHHDPAMQPLMQQLRGLTRTSGARKDADSPVVRAAATGEVFVGRFDLDAAVAAKISGDHDDTLAVLRPAWMICVPVQVGLRRLGALSVVRAYDQPPFGTADQAVLEQLAERAGVALAHARDFDDQRQAALTLQRHLLPTPPDLSRGVEVVVRYQAAEIGSEVGGDWYDVLELEDGTIAIAVGDVEGHDLAAAAMMAQVRAIVHAQARAGLPPAQVAHEANSFVLAAPSERLVTMGHLHVDPRAGLVVSVRAGHVPALVVPPDGPPWVLTGRGGLPLGVDTAARWEESTTHVPGGSTIAVLTDGLVETPQRDVEEGLAELADLLSRRVGADLETLADEVLVHMTAGGASDDIALVLLRLPPDTGEHERSASRRLPAALWAAPLLRRFTGDVLAHWGITTEVADIAGLLVTELVSNAARHSDETIELRLSLAAGRIRAEVFDDSHRLPQLLTTGPYDTSGRGLQLVDRLSARWGVQAHGRGKVVWFELAVPASG